MILTKEKIDQISKIWDTEIFDIVNIASSDNETIVIDQKTLKYLLIKFFELQNDLDNITEEIND